MDFNKRLSTASTTAGHKDPKRAGVGTTAFGAAFGRAMATKDYAKTPIARDPVACALFDLRTRPKEIPLVFTVLYSLWCLMPLSWLFFVVVKWIYTDFFKISDMLGMRTKFIDDSVTTAVEKKGIGQVVILGAGLDARATRLPALFSAGGAAVFEVDFQGMIDVKRSMFAQIGHGSLHCNSGGEGKKVISVGTDFSQPPERWKSDLVAAGFDKGKPCVWILEGLTGYLKQEELEACFGALSSLSAPGSEVVATWNGRSAREKPAPWTQNIHVSLVDNPDPLLAPFKWKTEEHIAVGAATKMYNATGHIVSDDKSYWFSRHVKL